MNEFIVKSKQLANYLISHGSKLIRKENYNTYIFEKDESIDKNIEQWEFSKKNIYF